MKRGIRGPAKYPLILSAVVLVLFGLGAWLMQGQHIPVLMPSGSIASQERDLIVFTVALAAIIVIPVFVLLGAFAWKYREQNNATYQPESANNTVLEVIWWGIPIAIIVLLSIITWRTSHSLDPYRAIKSDNKTLEVEVVALQWKWLFIYPDQSVATINDLTIPVDTPVHFHLSADSPMSAFWVPDLGGQIYTMNGMSSQLHLIANKVGTYTGYNTNINGDGYADMTFKVHAVDDAQFKKWHETHAKSDIGLTKIRLESLMQPERMKEPMYMSLPDGDPYDSIIEKYMQGSGHATMNSMQGTSDMNMTMTDHGGTH
ncbi:MAG TPA: ubiquinol oxidase subunit II [Patescibacteria group bacterium]|jgi:cytochrome o ubiquinol oxidase subunit 2|nr:ubiquinol oxidase subunit II [Patescibacteria group bacterium]